MPVLSFDRMPPVGGAWLRVLRPRPGLRPGATVPRIEARVGAHHADPAWVQAWRQVTGEGEGGTLAVAAPQALALPLHMKVLTAPGFPLPLLGAVHVRQQIDVVRPLRLDETAAVGCWVEGAREARRGVEIDLHTTWTVGEETVWHGVTTFLSRGRGAKRGGGPAAEVRTAAAPRDPDVPAAPDVSETWSLPGDLGRRFAKVAGDRNPIHMYAWTARLFGFRQPIIHGMWTLARCLVALEGRVPSHGIRVACSFRRPLPLPGIAALAAWRAGDVERFVVRDGAGRNALVGSVAPIPPGRSS